MEFGVEVWKVASGVGALLVSALSLAWAIWSGVSPRRARLKEALDNAVESKKALPDATLDGLIEERGYQLLAGRTDIPVPVIRYLLGLREPGVALRFYPGVRHRVAFMGRGDRGCLIFKGLWRSAKYRRWARRISWIAYLLFYAGASSPLILHALNLIGSRQAWQLAVLTVILFGPLCYISLRYGANITRAERLVALQEPAGKSIRV